jgi:hypothetical protein
MARKWVRCGSVLNRSFDLSGRFRERMTQLVMRKNRMQPRLDAGQSEAPEAEGFTSNVRHQGWRRDRVRHVGFRVFMPN